MTYPSSQPKDEDSSTSAPEAAEFELKFVSDAVGLRRVAKLACLCDYPLSNAKRLQTIYFDTEQGSLLQHGISLRLRKWPRGRNVMTFKGPGTDAFSRREIEISVGPDGLDISKFDLETQAAIRKICHDAPLVERYATDFRRKTINIQTERSLIEIALDQGSFVTNGQSHPLYEVEIELKLGDRAEAVAWAKKIALEAQIQLETISKAERCAVLAGFNLPIRSAKLEPFVPNASLDFVIARLLSECLRHYMDYLHPFREEHSPLAVHQMRVALRRLRAALKVFAKAFPETSFRSYADRARTLATGLGDARDCDAFRQLAFGEALQHPSRPIDAPHLESGLDKLRADAYERASALIESEFNLTFILDMQIFILERAWRSEATDSSFVTLSAPATYFARETLDRLLRQARRKGKDILNRSDEERHDLRISLKNLRYNAHLLAPLFTIKKSQKTWFSDLSALQEILGLHNDLANAQIMLERLQSFAEDDFSQSAGFIMGWHACNGHAADQKIEKTWKRFRSDPAFWS